MAPGRELSLPAVNVKLNNWFISPVPPSEKGSERGPVRIWGKAIDGRGRVRLWRSSSVYRRIAANHLVTRYGTHIWLTGGLDRECAANLNMTKESVAKFRVGFPRSWRNIVETCFVAKRIAKMGSFRSARPPKPKAVASAKSKLTDFALNSAAQVFRDASVNDNGGIDRDVKRRKRRAAAAAKKRVAFTFAVDDYDGVESGDAPKVASPEATPKPSRAASAPAKGATWSSSQIDAYNKQRNSVAADHSEYWDEIAAGVEGKSGTECRERLESLYKSSSEKAGVPAGRRQRMVSTPEIAAGITGGSRRRKQTGKFKSEMRRVAAAVARDTDDRELEPDIDMCGVGEAMGGVVDGMGGKEGAQASLAVGTPGTEVRAKRTRAERAGNVKTPEILARGRSFGLHEADQYVAAFKRRAGSKASPRRESKGVERDGKSTPRLVAGSRGRLEALNDISVREACAEASDGEGRSDDEIDLFF